MTATKQLTVGSIRRKTYTKPLPDGAELFTRKGETFARWKDGRGKTRTAPATTGADGSSRIVATSRKWLAKYRNGDGSVIEVSTGCTDKGNRDRRAGRSSFLSASPNASPQS